MSNRLAPNGNYIRWSYAGADGVFLPLSVIAASEPLTMQYPLATQTVRTDIVGGLVSGPAPLPKGKLQIMNIQATATTSTPYNRIVAGADGFTGTNATLTRTVDVNVRLVTLRKTVDVKSIQGQSFYQDFTGAELRFPADVAEADTGNTLDVSIDNVWGTVGTPVPLSSP